MTAKKLWKLDNLSFYDVINSLVLKILCKQQKSCKILLITTIQIEF
jgi:hypothetical protein